MHTHRRDSFGKKNLCIARQLIKTKSKLHIIRRSVTLVSHPTVGCVAYLKQSKKYRKNFQIKDKKFETQILYLECNK